MPRFRRGRSAALVTGAITVAIALSGCSTDVDLDTDGRPVVAGSVAPITDIVNAVAGEYAHVVGLIPPGVDSHTFEPTPQTARVLSRTEIVFFNGLGLEEPTIRMAASNQLDGGERVFLGDKTITPEAYVYDFSFPRSEGRPNPHAWMNPALALRYSEIVTEELVRRFPDVAEGFHRNQRRFAERVGALDAAIAESILTIPPQHRKLLTYHDSFAYFAPRYGMTVVGAAQLANFQEPSAREIAELVGQVRSEQVRAVFGSEVFPSRILEQVAREADAIYVDTLRDDELPDPPRNSYIGMMIDNVETITVALGGDPSALAALPPSVVIG